MKIITATASTTDPVLDLSGRFHPASQGLTVVPDPSDRTAGDIALSTLLALGKDFGRGGARTTRHAELRSEVAPWLEGFQITTVALTSADLLDSRNAKWFVEMLPADTTVVMIAENGSAFRPESVLTEPVLAAHGGIRAEHVDYDELLLRYPPADTEPPPSSDADPYLSVDDLPVVHPLRFLAESRRALPDWAYAHVEAHYSTTFWGVVDQDAKYQANPRSAVIDALQQYASPCEAVIRIHALSAALFRLGFNFTIDQEVAYRYVRLTPSMALGPSEWRRLNAFALTAHAAQAALYLTDHTVRAIEALTIREARQLVDAGGPASPYLRAHLAKRRTQGAEAEDRFITTGMTSDTLRRCRDSLDLPITGHPIDGDTRRSDSVIAGLTYTLEQLT